jgi:purine nucleosidase
MQPIVLDADMGVDDALAVALALHSPELELAGITVVAGNVAQDQGTRNALQVLELFDRDDVPVFVGAAQPLRRAAVDATSVHGNSGLGYAELAEPRTVPAGSAVEYLIDEIRMRPGELVIVATGPLTNLALAERRAPGILNSARRVVAMGGALWCGGNITPHSEYNIHADPHALIELLQAQVNLTLVPLDVTHQLLLTAADIAAGQSQCSDTWSDFFDAATRRVIEYGRESNGLDGLHLHDPAVLALLIEPSLFQTRTLHVNVKAEGTQAGHIALLEEEDAGALSVNCAVEVDAAGVMQLLRHRLMNI